MNYINLMRTVTTSLCGIVGPGLIRCLLVLTIVTAGSVHATTIYHFSGEISGSDPIIPIGVGTAFSGTLTYTPELATPSGSPLGTYMNLFTFEISIAGYTIEGDLDNHCPGGPACDWDPETLPSIGGLFPEDLYWTSLDIFHLLSPEEVLADLIGSQWVVFFIDFLGVGTDLYLTGDVQVAKIVPESSSFLPLSMSLAYLWWYRLKRGRKRGQNPAKYG